MPKGVAQAGEGYQASRQPQNLPTMGGKAVRWRYPISSTQDLWVVMMGEMLS